jgi:hypothetical protein
MAPMAQPCGSPVIASFDCPCADLAPFHVCLFVCLFALQHDSWTQTYADPAFFEWLSVHKKPVAAPAGFVTSVITSVKRLLGMGPNAKL